MYAEIQTAALNGVEAVPVRVECHVTPGLPSVQITGLPDGAVRDAVPRIISAARFCDMPIRLTRRVVVNLVPGDLPKRGSSFDLPIALGMLAALGHCDPAHLSGVMAFGELGLDGRIVPVKGILALASTIASRKHLMVAPGNAAEAREVQGVAVLAPATLKEALDVLLHKERGVDASMTLSSSEHEEDSGSDQPDLADIKGQCLARRALEIAAAGGHNLLMIGAPGTGKTMLARCLPGILPRFSHQERLEASRIHSIAGLIPPGKSLLRRRPFRAPHATVSDAGMIGSGRFPHLGEVSLAHRGVLFLDEFPEFRRRLLEQLRQPLEDGEVSLVRAGLRMRLPARFSLIAAMNPCPCGNLGDSIRQCRCKESEILKYRNRLSGPVLDRIDLQVSLSSLSSDEWISGEKAEASRDVRIRVEGARKQQEERSRLQNCGVSNAELRGSALRDVALGHRKNLTLLARAMDYFQLSARAADRTLRVARTIADLGESKIVEPHHLAEALQLRTGQKKLKE